MTNATEHTFVMILYRWESLELRRLFRKLFKAILNREFFDADSSWSVETSKVVFHAFFAALNLFGQSCRPLVSAWNLGGTEAGFNILGMGRYLGADGPAMDQTVVSRIWYPRMS